MIVLTNWVIVLTNWVIVLTNWDKWLCLLTEWLCLLTEWLCSLTEWFLLTNWDKFIVFLLLKKILKYSKYDKSKMILHWPFDKIIFLAVSQVFVLLSMTPFLISIYEQYCLIIVLDYVCVGRIELDVNYLRHHPGTQRKLQKCCFRK